MESNSDQERKNKTIYEVFPFLFYIKSRLVSYVNPKTKKRYRGHVAMFYNDTKKIRIDWENGARTSHNFTEDSKWIFHLVPEKDKK